MLCLVFALVTVSLADEITFRGIPWGTPAYQVEILLIDQLGNSTYTYARKDQMPYLDAMTEITLYPHTEQNTGYSIVAMVRPKPTVAGYDVYAINCYSYFGRARHIPAERFLDSKFFAAEYQLKADNLETAYNDLQGKLTYLYGECISTKDKRISDYYHCTSTWRGDNNTAVSLVAHYSSDEDDDKSGTVKLMYYKTDCDETLRAIENAVKSMELEKQYKDSDLNGL